MSKRGKGSQDGKLVSVFFHVCISETQRTSFPEMYVCMVYLSTFSIQSTIDVSKCKSWLMRLVYLPNISVAINIHDNKFPYIRPGFVQLKAGLIFQSQNV